MPVVVLASAMPVAGRNLLTSSSFDTGFYGWGTSNTTWFSDDGHPSGSGPGCIEVTARFADGGLYPTLRPREVTAGATLSTPSIVEAAGGSSRPASPLATVQA